MFTGLIEETGTIKKLQKTNNQVILFITAKAVVDDIDLGDSICINGICLTVTSFDKNGFEVYASSETVLQTTISNWKLQDFVNLERALKAHSRLGGHIVQGHVDSICEIYSFDKIEDSYNISFRLDDELSPYIIRKGSICIDGISLTINESRSNLFSIRVIPSTFEATTVKNWKKGTLVNIETDIMGRYVVEYLKKFKNEISIETLKKKGF